MTKALTLSAMFLALSTQTLSASGPQAPLTPEVIAAEATSSTSGTTIVALTALIIAWALIDGR